MRVSNVAVEPEAVTPTRLYCKHVRPIIKLTALRQGFNMMYPFSSSDLTCSVAVLKNYMENAPSKVSCENSAYVNSTC